MPAQAHLPAADCPLTCPHILLTQLLKSILFPRQHRTTFASDALKFIAAMLLLGLLFYIWRVARGLHAAAPTGLPATAWLPAHANAASGA